MKTLKTKRFLVVAFALICLGSNAWADTNKLLAADGWTKITSAPTSSDIANNYYVFVDATRDLMLGTAKGVNQDTKWYSLGVYYQTSVGPTTADINGKTWILESQDGGYAMRNLEYSVLMFQTEWNANSKWDTNDVQTPNGWAKINLAYSNGYWTIENGHDVGNYIGPWTAGNFTNGAECAGNKTAANDIGHFQIYAISRAQFKQNLLDNASNSNPVDLTPWYVSNATFDAGSRTGWTEEGSGGNNNTSFGGGCEIWHRSNFKIYQNLTLPNGKYKVSLQIAGTTGAGQVYATSGSTTRSASSSAAAGDNFQNTVLSMIQDRAFGKVTTEEIEVSNGSLQMGMKCETTDQWLVFDNFKLFCTGVDLSAYQTQLSDLVTECNDFIASSVVPDACETLISDAVTTYNQEYSTAKEYSAAIVALTNVLETYSNDAELKSAYAAYKTMRTNVQGLADNNVYHYTDPGTAKSTFDGAVLSANSAVEAATTASAINALKAVIRAAAMTFISSVTAEDGNPFNLTFLASTAAADWQTASGLNPAATAPSWSVPKPDPSMADFVESYTEAAGGESITGNILYQTVGDMPAGYYTVALYAAASYTPNRGSLVEKCTDGQQNITYGFAGESSLSLPVAHRTSLTAEDQVPVNLSVQLSSAGPLSFGIKKTAAGSNWHVAQIYTITYSKDPDLTVLKADRDALVSEAEGILAGEDADLLTTAQKGALQDAIDEGNDANTFDDLTTATLTTLPNAIQTARQQIQDVKDNRVRMLEALQRFETGYNLADGTDYRRLTMSADAWASLIAKVNAVSEALDDLSQSASYGTLADELVSQMDATDASLRLFSSYKAMVDGTTALGIAGSYGADGYMDTDDAQETAIAALNTAFATYAAAQSADFDVSAFLGANLDFSAAEGALLNGDNSNNIRAVTGWDVSYADADTWTVVQTHQGDNDGKLYMRKNWGSAAASLSVSKLKMLPVGKYRLSVLWNSDLANMTNLSAYKLGEVATVIGEATNGAKTLSYEFEVTGSATPFDLIFGFQKTGSGNTPAQLLADDVQLTALGVNSVLVEDYDPAAPEFDVRSYVGAVGVTLVPTNPNQIIYANAGQLTNDVNVVIDGVCARFVITDKQNIATTSGFEATAAEYTREMNDATQYGTLILPFAIDVAASDVNFFTLHTSDTQRMSFTPVNSAFIASDTPLLFKKKTSGATSITVRGADCDVPVIDDPDGVPQGEQGWTAKGYYEGVAELDGAHTYYISSDKFWESTGTLNMQPFRVVYVNSGSGESEARSFIINIEETPTGIDVVIPGDKALKDGKRLENGRIVIVKNGVKYRTNGQPAQ